MLPSWRFALSCRKLLLTCVLCAVCFALCRRFLRYEGYPSCLTPVLLLACVQNPAFCNRSTAVDALVACTAQWLRAVADDNPQRPLFVLAYGVPSYVDVATGVQQALAAPRTARSVATFNIIGVQDAAVLGRQPGTVHRTQDETTTAP